MKSIIGILFLVFTLGMLYSLNAQSVKSTETIILQSSNTNVSANDLKLSGEILRSRLKDYGISDLDLKLDPDKVQLSLNFSNRHVDIPEYLLTHKGLIGFYEIYNRELLSKIYSKNTELIKLINSIDLGNANNSELGCLDLNESNNILNRLNLEGGNEVCKFISTSQTLNSKNCIYAVNVNTDISKSINGSEIEYINLSNETGKMPFQIEMQFKKDAIAKWSEFTEKNINKGIAVCVDNEVFFVPIMRSKIEGGKCIISGDLPTQQLKLFKAIGNCLTLPTSFIIVK